MRRDKTNYNRLGRGDKLNISSLRNLMLPLLDQKYSTVTPPTGCCLYNINVAPCHGLPMGGARLILLGGKEGGKGQGMGQVY